MNATAKPNIILFMSDQHNVRFSGCYGDTITRTATLDRLASEGVVFDNCYCGNPLCVPSRMSFLTARHCHQIGVWDNGDYLRSDIATFAHGLGLAGYRTVLVGRMHFLGGDQLHGFQERVLGDVSPSFVGRNRVIERDSVFFGGEPSVFYAGPGPSLDLDYDMAVAGQACRVIYDHATTEDPRPLAMVVSFIGPHEPLMVPPDYYNRYAGRQSLPGNYRPAEAETHPFWSRAHTRYGGVSQEDVLRTREAYSAKVDFLDDQIGRVMQYLTTSKLDPNLIVYTSDHGETAGEHGLWAKGTFFDGSAKVPLIVSAPGLFPSGVRVHSNVSMLDIGPTLLDVAGGPPLPHAAGRSLSDLARGNDPQWPDTALCEAKAVGLGRMVRRGAWKLNVYQDHPEELFNIEEDPLELNDRRDDPDLSEIRNSLRAAAGADGWNPETIRQTIEARDADRDYLIRWVQTVDPKDPAQWAAPAPL